MAASLRRSSMKFAVSVPVLALLAVLFPASLFAGESWNKVESQHFVVVGDVSHGRLTSVARTLERFRLATAEIFPSREVAGARPLTVVVVGRNTMLSFVESDFIAGFYRSGGNDDFIVMRADMPNDAGMEIAL